MTYAIITAFLAGFALDLLYCIWIRSINSTKYVQAALASMAIGLCGLVGLGQALHGGWAAVSYLCGLGAGTVTGLLYARR